AVNDPKPGTMLTVFDALADAMAESPATFDGPWRERVLRKLEEAVLSTPELLPKLKAAGVVDAGALGLFIFLEGFFHILVEDGDGFRPIAEVFKGRLKVSRTFTDEGETGCCVDTVLRIEGGTAGAVQGLSAVGESVVVLQDGEYLKIHLHAADGRKVRDDLAAFGKVVRWSADDLGEQVRSFSRRPVEGAIHVMTDAAGSIGRKAAAMLGMTVLDSYITVGERSLPETHFVPEELYAAMRRGGKVSTAQASVFERHEHYRSALGRFSRVLYLCVGSAFTGNFREAESWRERCDPEGRFTVIDSGAASGRLGLAALAVARYAGEAGDGDEVIRFAREAAGRCREYVFLDTLRYLAAGGRLSRTSALFGDMLHMKPVISPLPEGAMKVGVVRNKAEQVKFALEKMSAELGSGGRAVIMLEYTDNRDWVKGEVQPEIARRWPEAELILQPMSLTSGAHMGPGTWAVAFLPECL
ncbi:MAG: DegV family EDD domain-containing protein, partial [Deltaproteobacteria bacterium]|nr:DegV family EDD domain-containing protein [Deltaproteobacteria bacterium]